MINLIGGTRTRTGLSVKAVLDTNQYDTGIAISDEDIGQLCLKRHKVHPDWNYTLLPRASTPASPRRASIVHIIL